MNDRDEVAGLYERFGHPLYRRCLALLGNEEEARELLQETFCQFWRDRAKFEGRSSEVEVRGWAACLEMLYFKAFGKPETPKCLETKHLGSLSSPSALCQSILELQVLCFKAFGKQACANP